MKYKSRTSSEKSLQAFLATKEAIYDFISQGSLGRATSGIGEGPQGDGNFHLNVVTNSTKHKLFWAESGRRQIGSADMSTEPVAVGEGGA